MIALPKHAGKMVNSLPLINNFFRISFSSVRSYCSKSVSLCPFEYLCGFIYIFYNQLWLLLLMLKLSEI